MAPECFDSHPFHSGTTGTSYRELLVLALALCSALLVPSRSLAQTCAILSDGQPHEGTMAPPEARQLALETVTAHLMREGITVISPDDVHSRLAGDIQADCANLECAPGTVRALGVDFAVLITLYASGGVPRSVQVSFVGDDVVAGDAPVEGELAAATLQALNMARQRWESSHTGFLVVRTEPPNAEVRVDQRVVGASPLRHLVSTGVRQVSISAVGYTTVERQVSVQAHQEHELNINLAPASVVSESPPRPVFHQRASVYNWLVAGGLGALAIGTAIPGFYALARQGECDQMVGGRCQAVVEADVITGALLVVSAAALVGAVVVVATEPFQVSVQANPQSATLRIRGSF